MPDRIIAMRGREKGHLRRRALFVAVAALAAVLALGAASSAVAKKKKGKKVPPAVTLTATAPLSSASTASTTANCTGKTHLSGGGYAIAPHFEPSTTSGLSTSTSTSTPVGVTAWNVKSDALTNPPTSGSLTAMARCESNSLSQIATVVSGSDTVLKGILDNLVIHCPTGTHVVSAGYDGTGVGSYLNALPSFRILILQSRRTALNEWTISALENNFNAASGTINVSALCERDVKGRSIGEVSTISPFGNASRAAGDPTCPAKQHVVSGGYVLSPIPSGSGNAPIVGIDEFEPVGKSTWHLGLHTFAFAPPPPGSSVATYAYCAKDTAAKTKKKKKKK
jgi:hypothetical protein